MSQRKLKLSDFMSGNSCSPETTAAALDEPQETPAQRNDAHRTQSLKNSLISERKDLFLLAEDLLQPR